MNNDQIIDPELLSIDTPGEAEEVRQRCPYELFVIKYFGLPEDVSFNETPKVSFADFVNVLCMFTEEKEKAAIPIPAPEKDRELITCENCDGSGYPYEDDKDRKCVCCKGSGKIAIPSEKEESQERNPTMDDVLKQMKEVEDYRESLQTSMSVEGLLKELTIDRSPDYIAEKVQVWNSCVVALRERIKGKHLIVDKQLSDLWDAAAREALDFLFRELENRFDKIPEIGRPGIKSLIDTYKEKPWPIPDKASYLKEHFGIQ